jgi:3-methyladenine DNA glycosylase AlkD
MNADEILQKLKSMANPAAVEGMARYGINPHNNLGISIYELRRMAKDIGPDHPLALALWDSGLHDARLLACFVDDPVKVTAQQMDRWAADFDSWDVCDQACTSLFDVTPLAWEKVFEWAERPEEFVKRGAFSLIAGLAVHDRNAEDARFEQFIPLVKKHADDDRNYVKKAVNWAIRNIGKRNCHLNTQMIQLAEDLLSTMDSKTARWVASHALRELKSDKVQARIRKKK